MFIDPLLYNLVQNGRLDGLRAIKHLSDDSTNGSSGTFIPEFTVWVNDDGATLSAELPGVVLDDLEIQVIGNTLSLKGEKKLPNSENLGKCVRNEQSYGKFVRKIELPFAVSAETVKAELTSGILMITLPKAETEKPRRISVTAK